MISEKLKLAHDLVYVSLHNSPALFKKFTQAKWIRMENMVKAVSAKNDSSLFSSAHGFLKKKSAKEE